MYVSHQHLLNVTWILFPPTALRSVGCGNREDSVCALLGYIFAVYMRNKLIECYGCAENVHHKPRLSLLLKTLPPPILRYVGHWFVLALLSPMQIFHRLGFGLALCWHSLTLLGCVCVSLWFVKVYGSVFLILQVQ